ncbi:MAG: AMP-binding protein, partial [Bacteroidota bacterium]
ELFYSKWRGILGGNLKTVLCGGAKMQRELFHLFWAAKVPLLQGYGLSETSGLISIDRHGDIIKLNKCGRSMNHIEVKLAEDGEILARGIPIMLGYYKHPEITAQEIDSEGWFKSGDIGTIDEDGYIEIISRKKSTFKNMSGKYVYPETLEGMLKKSGLIGNVIVTGVNRPNLVALIVPDFEFLKTWCDNNGIEFSGPQQMIVDERVIQAFRKAIDEYNVQNWTETERISDFVLLADQWSIETGEYTPTMKVRRNAVLEKYNDLIERIYKK